MYLPNLKYGKLGDILQKEVDDLRNKNQIISKNVISNIPKESKATQILTKFTNVYHTNEELAYETEWIVHMNIKRSSRKRKEEISLRLQNLSKIQKYM